MEFEERPEDVPIQHSERPPSTVTLCLHEVLESIEAGLTRSADETKLETDPLPRNLLAAMHRAKSHVTFYSRLHSQPSSQVKADDSVASFLSTLQKDLANEFFELERELHCLGGFLHRSALSLDGSECKKRLEGAATRMQTMALKVREIRSLISGK